MTEMQSANSAPLRHGLKSRILHSMHAMVYRYWVDPLQRLIVAVAAMKPGRWQQALLRSVTWLTNLGRLLITDFRVNVVRLSSTEWSIVYIGAGISIEEVCHALFASPVAAEKLARVFVWKIPAVARQFADQDDLVVCEMNPLIHWRPRDGLSFGVPAWIDQALDIGRRLDDILAGMNQNMRRQLRKMERQGYTYRFGRDEQDFDFFFHKMLRPYAIFRHGERSVGATGYDSVRLAYRTGGLIIVERDGEPICAMLCHIVKNACEAGPMGVHERHFDEARSGANVALWWFMMDWARGHNLKTFKFGGSRARTADGVFNFKRQWGTRVVAQHDIEYSWTFYSRNLPPRLRQYLNHQGLISQIERRFYRVLLAEPGVEPADADLQSAQADAARCGLEGVLVISAPPSADMTQRVLSLLAHPRT